MIHTWTPATFKKQNHWTYLPTTPGSFSKSSVTKVQIKAIIPFVKDYLKNFVTVQKLLKTGLNEISKGLK